MKYKLETELCSDILKWLIGQGWTCYQEVVVPDARGPVDIVALRDNRVRVVEAKLTLSWELLSQAQQHVDYAHETCIATPGIKSDWHQERTKDEVCGHLKINRIVVSGPSVKCDFSQYNHDANAAYFLNAVKQEHRINGIAGSKAGTAWTPWKMEVAQPVAEFVRDNPGCTLKQIIEIPTVKNYYRNKGSARAALRQWLERGVIRAVRSENDHGKRTYWPKTELEKRTDEIHAQLESKSEIISELRRLKPIVEEIKKEPKTFTEYLYRNREEPRI